MEFSVGRHIEWVNAEGLSIHIQGLLEVSTVKSGITLLLPGLKQLAAFEGLLRLDVVRVHLQRSLEEQQGSLWKVLQARGGEVRVGGPGLQVAPTS